MTKTILSRGDAEPEMTLKSSRSQSVTDPATRSPAEEYNLTHLSDQARAGARGRKHSHHDPGSLYYEEESNISTSKQQRSRTAMQPVARPSTPVQEEQHAPALGPDPCATAPELPVAHADVEAEIADLQRKKMKMERK
jgi:hypothetical protein